MKKQAAAARIQVRSETIRNDIMEAYQSLNNALEILQPRGAQAIKARMELVRAQQRIESALTDADLVVEASKDV